MKSRWHRLSIAISLLSLSAVCWPHGVIAQEVIPAQPTEPRPEFAIQAVGDFPLGYFDVSLLPGESTSLVAEVLTTETSSPVSVVTFSTIAVHPPNGGFGAGSEDDQDIGAASWVVFPTVSLELAAGDAREIPFTVSVPADALPGEYVAALVVQSAGPLPIPGMETFDHVVRSSIGLTITVPGPATFGFDLGSPELKSAGSLVNLVIPVSNTGNYSVRPSGVVQIFDQDDVEIAHAPVDMKAVYGGNTALLQISLPQAIPTGDYKVSASLVDKASGTAATLDEVLVTLEEIAEELASDFTLDSITIVPVADPIQYLDVSIAVTNGGAGIPTANVSLDVSYNGEFVETFALSEDRTLANGPSDITGRYIPPGGWQDGEYTFVVQITAVAMDTGVEVVLAEGQVTMVLPTP